MLLKNKNLPKTPTSSTPPQKNQKLVIICLGLTIFLSLAFLVYRKVIPIFNGSKSLILKLPSIQPNTSTNFDSIPPSWSLLVGKLSNGQSTVIYSRNIDIPIDTFIEQLKPIHPTKSSIIKDSLPQGAVITEADADPQAINFQYLITLPQFEIVMLINNPDRSEANLKLIPQIATTLYWGLVGSR